MTTVVFMHGQPGAGSDWDEVVRHLPDGLDVLAPDRPGYRSNPLPPSGLDSNARWLLDTLDRTGIDQAVLVGHSYGGGVVLNAAAMAPHRVRGLVLVASVGPDCLDGWDHLLAAPVIGAAMSYWAFALTPVLARLELAHIRRKLGRSLRSDEHIGLDTWANARHDQGAMWRTFLLEQRDLVHNAAALDRAIANVRAPALLLADPKDTVVPIRTAHALQDVLPDTELTLVEDGGHALPRQTPETVAAAITSFVDSLG
jgi:3-oxoadipate enol-lactonase